uniref:Uncharacterized protein TCIL3000_11_14700 n=1 Tax=Trypanosoma congolense (strain IL3000) TaxID=1068625 RepID=G0V2T1_TRYCI|nr:unnamed protein product [Trypanosoma congolense IL3000]
MSEGVAHHFLLETQSQQLHRLEAIRRRRELLEREAKKPIQMRFGIDSRSMTWSRTPPVVGNRGKVGGVSSRLRPHSSEPKRNHCFPPRRSSSEPPPQTGGRDAVRRAALVSLATTSASVNKVRGKFDPKSVCKRSRSLGADSRSNSRTQVFRKHDILSSARNREKLTSQSARSGSFSASPTPPLPAVAPHGDEVQKPQERWSPSPRAASFQDAVPTEKIDDEEGHKAQALVTSDMLQCEPNMFPLPGSRSISLKESKELSAVSFTSPMSKISRESADRACKFRISEFPEPRTPKRRVSITVSLSPASSVNLNVINSVIVASPLTASDACATAGGVEPLQCYENGSLERSSPANLFDHTSTNIPATIADAVEITQEAETRGDCKSEMSLHEGDTHNFEGNEEHSLRDALSTAVCGDAETAHSPSPKCEESARVTPSAASSNALECSPTTTEFEGAEGDKSDLCQLVNDPSKRLDMTMSAEKDDIAHVNPYEEEALLEDKDAHDVDSGSGLEVSELFTVKDAIEQPEGKPLSNADIDYKDEGSLQEDGALLRTPLPQVLHKSEEFDDAPQGEHSSCASPTSMKQEASLVDKQEGFVINSRGSLILVSGESTNLYTPPLQEPHTPVPDSPPRSFSKSKSPLPRPVTLFSRVRHVKGEEITVPQQPSTGRDARNPDLSQPRCKEVSFPPERYNKTPMSTSVSRTHRDATEDNMARQLATRGDPSPSSSRSGRKPLTERLLQACPSDVREEIQTMVSLDTSNRTPARTHPSLQRSVEASGGSSISQRVASRPRKDYNDYTDRESCLRQVASPCAQEWRKALKRTRDSQTLEELHSPNSTALHNIRGESNSGGRSSGVKGPDGERWEVSESQTSD